MSHVKLVITAVSLLILTSVFSFAAILNVPSGTYPTIQSAIDAANDADTIEVATGSYAGIIFGGSFNANNVLLHGDITNKPVITGGIDFNGYPDVIDGLTFQNFVIKGKVATDNGIIHCHGNNPEVKNFKLENCTLDGEKITDKHGILGKNFGSDFTIKNCIIKDIMGWAVIDTDSGSGDYEGYLKFDTITFEGNSVYGCNGSIVFRGISPEADYTDEVIIKNCYINNIGNNTNSNGVIEQGEQWAAIEINHTKKVTITDTYVSDVDMGIWDEGEAFQIWTISDSLTMSNCEIYDNYQGIYYYSSDLPDTSAIHNCCFHDNDQYAMFVPTTCSGTNLLAINNWWGASDGPGGDGSGSGDAVLGKIDFNPWSQSEIGCLDENAIDLVGFSANRDGKNIQLSWQTGTEIDNLGYYIVKSGSVDNGYTLLNSKIIPAQGNAYSGHSYSYVDNNVNSGHVYYYWLVDIDIYGQYAIHGPVKAITDIEEYQIVK
jgi:hypothetical protein